MVPAAMSFREQLLAIRRTRVLVGFHGAALAHMLFLHEDASVLELTTQRYSQRTNFAMIARNTGVSFMMHIMDSDATHADGHEANAEWIKIPIAEIVDLIALHAPLIDQPQIEIRNYS